MITPNSDLRKIALIGDYLPRKCGIATFTHDLRQAIATQFPEAECIVVPVNDIVEGYEYAPEVRFEIAETDLSSYRRAADFLNFSNVDVVSPLGVTVMWARTNALAFGRLPFPINSVRSISVASPICRLCVRRM